MKKSLILVAALAVGAALNASATIVITVDENGNGTWDGAPLVPAGGLANDTGPGGLANALTYYLQISSTSIGFVTPGDLKVTEPGSSALSDLIRFRSGNPLFFTPASFVFYSDNSDGSDSLADIGFPTAFNTLTFTMVEPGVEGGSQIIHYVPTPNQPGYVADPTNPGHAYVIYNFISDAGTVVPEPTTMIAGALLLLPFGASALRLLRKKQAA